MSFFLEIARLHYQGQWLHWVGQDWGHVLMRVGHKGIVLRELAGGTPQLVSAHLLAIYWVPTSRPTFEGPRESTMGARSGPEAGGAKPECHAGSSRKRC